MFNEGRSPNGGYSWFDDELADGYDVAGVVLRHSAGCTLVVTSFDSGPFEVSDDDRKRGWWVTAAGAAASPPIGPERDVPSGEYDEWWIFESVAEANAFTMVDAFVNQSAFTLGASDVPIARDQQTAFWNLVERFRPVAYVAEGSRVVVATRRDELATAVRAVLSTPRPRP